MEAEILQLKTQGFILQKSILNTHSIEQLQEGLELALAGCQRIFKQSQNQHGSLKGAAHHILQFSPAFSNLLLTLKPQLSLIEAYLGGKIILNSFGAFANDGTDNLYTHGQSIHRDMRTVNDNFKHQMVVILISLDEFTATNGATLVQPQSHTQLQPPNENEFNHQSQQAIMPSGSAVIFDGGLWHSAGINHDKTPRRALTLTFTRPYLKQQFDYANSTNYQQYDEQQQDFFKQILGYYARTPQTLAQWYSPPQQRFYRRDQG